MAATSKTVRKMVKKMGAESRASGKDQHPGVKKEFERMSVKNAKTSKGKKFAKSQY